MTIHRNFVHLNVHTEYSLIDAIIRPNDLIDAAIADKMPAIAVTDHVNLFALVKFYRAALSRGIKPIVGSDVWIDYGAGKTRLTLLCKNNLGYNNLTQLITKSYLQGQKTGQVLTDPTWLETFHEGLIVLSGAENGRLNQLLQLKNTSAINEYLDQMQCLFPDSFYIELCRVAKHAEQSYLDAVLPLAETQQLPVVATNSVCFLGPTDFEAHEARVCIHQGYTLDDPRRVRQHTANQYFKSQEEMFNCFSDIPEAIENTIEIAKRCNVTLNLGTPCLPNFPVPEGLSVKEYFIHAANTGLEKRLTHILGNASEQKEEDRLIYFNRLTFELNIIDSMGFAGYFLIVADFIQWSKNHDIPVGPGRGSGAGSLVAYALKITDLDPIYHELLFERFLNPERVSMPDFDIDFCMEGRDRVIEYVTQKYGKDRVSQIITYGRMAAKAVVRDVGRVLGHPYGFVDKIAKLIPFELGITLNKALAEEPQLKQRYEHEEDVKTLINLALKLEGIVRNAGKHAGGVVIAPSVLTDFAPLYCDESESSQAVTQFDKDDVESVGLVKFDFLGLRTLTIIDWAVKNIKQTTGKIIDISLIPINDQATYDLLKSCSTTAVFQLESRGMRDLVKRLQPDCFEEVVALVALFRPGPLQSGMVDDFIARKHGQAEIEYPHISLQPILQSTYGIILYQEQVMQIARVLSGYSLGHADILRRAMGKKKPEEMAKQRAQFVDGAVKNHISPKLATHVFNIIEKFAGYGFNKSHSAAYALLAYQTAYLKTHYPAEFMAAVLSSDMDNTDKVVIFVEECKRLKLTSQPPNINHSDYHFTVKSGEILFGLGAIKGVGLSAIENILTERANGPYTSLFDLCHRVDLRKANKRVIEALIRSGSLDCFGQNRATLMASLEIAQQSADQQAKNHAQGQNDLFSIMLENHEESSLGYIKTPDYSERERLRGEKETLGFYLSGHPVAEFANELRHFTTCEIAKINQNQQSSVVVAGMIIATRTLVNKKGKRMAFLTIEDMTGPVEITIFSKLYDDISAYLIKDQIIVVEGEIRNSDFTGQIQIGANKIMSLAKARSLYARKLFIRLPLHTLPLNFSQQLKLELQSHNNGSCPVYIQCCKQHFAGIVALGEHWKINVSDHLIEQLRRLCGKEAVEVEY